MKNLYLFSILCTLFCHNSFGQNLQNSNWITGSFNQQNLINFNPNANVLSTFSNTNSNNGNCEGVASVSDPDGNLLFYTDGISVFQRIGATDVLINANNLLRGDPSSTQNVVIVPRPGNINSYYIFTIVGGTTASTVDRGLFYTEFNFANPNGGVIVGTPNIPLRDNNNVVLDQTRNNRSEGLTSTRHSNCQDYWVIAHVTRANSNQGDLFSYHVTPNGIVNNLPTQTLPFNVNTASQRMIHTIKISPDTFRIAFTVSNLGLFLGVFNNTNGSITIPNINLPTALNSSIYGLEFSQDSNIIYYSDQTNSISEFDIINSLPQVISTTNQNDAIFGLQLGQDNRLYATTSLSSGQIGLSVVNDTNVLNTVFNNFFLLGDFSSLGLPQLVISHDCCLPTLTLVSPDDNMNNNMFNVVTHRERSQWIRASNLITSGNNNLLDGVVYHAGDFVELNPGFEALTGSQFSAYIEGCSDNYVYKNTNLNKDVKNNSTDLIKNKISIYPNPTSGLLNISLSNSKIKKVTLSSIEGKVYVFEQFDNSENIVLDLSNYASGIYLINVETDQGEIINSKVIKN